ncbi:hypothetical protein [Haloparvum sp. AD34]
MAATDDDVADDDDDEPVLELDTSVERWRLVCPAGHRGSKLKQRFDHWHCRQCKQRGIDPAYSYVKDQQTGRYLAPDEVEITTRSA